MARLHKTLLTLTATGLTLASLALPAYAAGTGAATGNSNSNGPNAGDNTGMAKPSSTPPNMASAPNAGSAPHPTPHRSQPMKPANPDASGGLSAQGTGTTSGSSGQ